MRRAVGRMEERVTDSTRASLRTHKTCSRFESGARKLIKSRVSVVASKPSNTVSASRATRGFFLRLTVWLQRRLLSAAKRSRLYRRWANEQDAAALLVARVAAIDSRSLSASTGQPFVCLQPNFFVYFGWRQTRRKMKRQGRAGGGVGVVSRCAGLSLALTKKLIIKFRRALP